MRATSNHGGQGRPCGQPRDTEAETIAAAGWLTTIELCSGLPEPEQIMALIERGRELPLSLQGARARVDLELLHSWLIENFGEDYVRLSRTVRAPAPAGPMRAQDGRGSVS